MDNTLKQYKLIVSYNGKYFTGWQKNYKFITVNGVLEDEVKRIHSFDKSINVIGVSRTDTGVHSKGQVCSFVSKKIWEPHFLMKSLNNCLKNKNIQILNCQLVDKTFSIFKSIKKTYIYRISYKPISPLFKDYIVFWHRIINIKKLKIAINIMKNHKDFFYFYKKDDRIVNCIQNNNCINLKVRSDHIELIFTGKAFLYHQIRYMVGHLLIYADGRRDLDYFMEPFINKIINYTKVLAPAHGLCLEEIFYNNN